MRLFVQQFLVRERGSICVASRRSILSKQQTIVVLRASSSSSSAPPPPPYIMTPPPPPSCPMHHASGTSSGGMQPPPTQHQWWPEQQNLLAPLFRNQVLGSSSHPVTHDEAAYRRRFAQLDLTAVERDLHQLMTTKEGDNDNFWPADYGHYGPFFIRMAWHSAGTYRTGDGRGGAGTGQLRFAPLNSWPDNGNLDKARRLLWPIKRKYGSRISWADLMILTGNVALESMGFPKALLGYAGGRVDVEWPEDHVDWGSENKWLEANRERYPSETAREELSHPLGAVQMGLIYVNPEGPNGVPDPLASARDIRETFARMAMNDEETVALIAGGHTFGKCHGAGDPSTHVGAEPEGAPIEAQGLGWKNSLGRGKGGDTITSGLEGAWTVNPAKWDHGYFEVLFGHEWELTKSPAGAQQWTPKNYDGPGVPDAHDPSKRHAPIMLTSDLALRMDPKYAPISKHFHENPQALEEAFAKAWYKLTHRDMGPISRCLGPKVPPPQLWQDPVPPLTYPTITAAHYQVWLKRALLEQAKLTPAQLVSVAWASASTFRQTDKRGGANGGRLLLSPQKEWACNAGLVSTLATMSAVQQQFNAQFHPVQVSMADLMVLGGCAGVEAAATAAGHEDVQVPFTPGRTDATQDMTDVESFAVLEPRADGFRNFLAAHSVAAKPEVLLVETADRLALTAKEMTVLLGGLRSIGLGGGGADDVALCRNVGQLSNEFFCNLLNDSVEWKETGYNLYQGVDRATGRVVWPSATRVDLIFGSHSVLRGLAESYATADSQKQFMIDFCAAFAKVMELDRFDVADMPTSRL